MSDTENTVREEGLSAAPATEDALKTLPVTDAPEADEPEGEPGEEGADDSEEDDDEDVAAD